MNQPKTINNSKITTISKKPIKRSSPQPLESETIKKPKTC
jgi:hypothetical protein